MFEERLNELIEWFIPMRGIGLELDDLRRYRLVVIFSFLIAPSGIIFGIIRIIEGNYSLATFLLVTFFLIIGVPFYLKYNNQLYAAGHTFLLILFFSLNIVTFFEGGLEGTALVWISGLPLVAILIMGKRSGLLWGGIVLTNIIIYFILNSIDPSFPPALLKTKPLHRFFSLIGFSIILIGLALLYERAKETILTKLELSNEELIQARDNADAANQTKSEFLANMSHEIRTPLNALIGYTELLLEEAEERNLDNFIADLKKIQLAEQTLLSLVNDILDISRIEAGKIDISKEYFSLDDFIEDALREFYPTIQQSTNSFSLDKPALLGMMYSDAKKIKQCLFNLLSNAFKFTTKGKIKLKIRLYKINEEKWIKFQVMDTGIGISEEQMKNLFEQFYQGDASITRKYEGTGLGLAISKKLCRLLGGTITVKSTLGKGSTFTISLPLNLDQVAPSKHDDEWSPEIHQAEFISESDSFDSLDSSFPAILIIDDKEETLEIMSRLLTKEGFKVVTCSTGSKGLELARQIRPKLIFLDVSMPQMDGWEVLYQLKNDPELTKIPVIMLTISDDQKKAHLLGASEFITKPINRNILNKILQRHYPKNNSSSILIVDDDESVREHLGRLIAKEGYQILQADNGKTALKIIKQTPPALIFLDLIMPKMDGFTFLQQLKEKKEWQNIPVIILTSKELTQEEKEFLQGRTPKILAKSPYLENIDLKEIKRLIKSSQNFQ